MPIFAFHNWLSKFLIWSYLHHTNVSDKQGKGKDEYFNLPYMFFRISLNSYHKMVYSIFMFCYLPNLIGTKYLSYHMLKVGI